MFRWLSVISTILTWPLISFGAFVRLKGAGLSCPDWPLCYGKLIPPPGYEISLEVGHRVVATLVGMLIVAMLVMAYQTRYKKYRTVSWALFILVSVQGILGGLTVIMKLSPAIVTFHLIGGNALFALLVYLSYVTMVEGKRLPKASGQGMSSFSKWQLGMLVLFFVMLTSGGANSSTYSGYACSGFPGCQENSAFSFHVGEGMIAEGYFFPIHRNEWIHMLHRLIVIGGSIWLSIYAWKKLYRHVSGNYRSVAIALWGLLLLEIGIGVINALYRVPVPVSAAHTGTAASIVGVMAYSFSKSLNEISS